MRTTLHLVILICCIRSCSAITRFLRTVFGVGVSVSPLLTNLPGRNISIARILSVWGDTNGALFIPDLDNQRILKFFPSSDTTILFAGTGISGYLENVPATNANFATPAAVWGDTNGVIFVVDQGNNRIRRVSTSGIVSLVAGGSSSAFSDNVAATSATFNGPGGIWVSRKIVDSFSEAPNDCTYLG